MNENEDDKKEMVEIVQHIEKKNVGEIRKFFPSIVKIFVSSSKPDYKVRIKSKRIRKKGEFMLKKKKILKYNFSPKFFYLKI